MPVDARQSVAITILSFPRSWQTAAMQRVIWYLHGSRFLGVRRKCGLGIIRHLRPTLRQGDNLAPKFLVFIRIAGIFAQAIEGKGDQGKIVKTRELDVSCGKGTVWNQGLSGTSPVKSSTLWG